jgi:undecaprenyl-diphosphatase
MFESLKLYDRDIFLFLNGSHSPVLDSFMYYVSQIWVFFPLFLYWLFLVYKKTGGQKLLILLGFMILLVTLTDQTSNQIKHAVKRYRPTHNLEIGSQVHTVYEYKGGQYGFFSGHASNSFGIAMFLCLLFSGKSPAFRSVFFLWAALTAYSRIYLGVHYPSDITVGIVTGLFWGFVVYKLAQNVFKKYFREIIAI